MHLRIVWRLALWSLAVWVLLWAGASRSAAEDVDRERMRGLDEQVQEVKSDVLAIAAELELLEEKLLYPSDTQVALFVSLEEGSSFVLDSARIAIDGEVVARHVYAFKELEALRKGGVQRIYTGNVPTGEHRLEVSVAGRRPDGEAVHASSAFTFEKDIEPKLVGITVSGDASSPSLELGGW